MTRCKAADIGGRAKLDTNRDKKRSLRTYEWITLVVSIDELNNTDWSLKSRGKTEST